jgi:hypothetical protein
MQTPVLVSLVKKDAAMLDAFGKGASEDIRKTKEELYRKLTQDPATGEIHCKLEKPNGEKTVQRSLPVSPNRVRVSPHPLRLRFDRCTTILYMPICIHAILLCHSNDFGSLALPHVLFSGSCPTFCLSAC